MEAKNYNVIVIENMINSAIQQSSDGSNIQLPIHKAEEVIEFLDTINSQIEILQIQNAYINGKGNAEKLAKKYFDKLITELKKHKNIEFTYLNTQRPWGDEVEKIICEMLPLRNKMVDFFIMIYENTNDSKFVHSLFKILLQFSFDEYWAFSQVDTSAYYGSDHKRNFVYDVFLNTITYLLKTEKFTEASYLLNNHYQVEITSKNGLNVEPKRYESHRYPSFCLHIASIDDSFRRQINGLDNHFEKHKNLYNDLLKNNFRENPYYNYIDLASTDLLLSYISFYHISIGVTSSVWLAPTRFSYINTQNEVMLKSVSHSVFKDVVKLFGISTIEEFSGHINNVINMFHQFIDNNPRTYQTPTYFLNLELINTQY